MLFKKLASSSHPPQSMTVESGQCSFHYLIHGSVCYLTLTARGYPKKLAFQYLQELQREFSKLYGTTIDQVSKPYAFIKFDTFIQKTKKLYEDTGTARNMSKLTEELQEVHQVMTKNIGDILAQGEKLEDMSRMSSALKEESKKYSKRATDLYRQAALKKWAPAAALVLLGLLYLLLRRFYYK